MPLPHINNRTLAQVRWMAIGGQAFTVLATNYGLGIDLPVLHAMGWIALSAAFNILTISAPRLPRLLTSAHATAYLAFDLLQLTALLYLTGGLENPFSILLIAPVTVGASLLPFRHTARLAALAGLAATVLAFWHLPLRWPDDRQVFTAFYILGQWIALTFSAAFIAVYVWKTVSEARRMTEGYHAAQMALSRQQKIAALGAQAAAAAHELGSPLNTITLIAAELARDAGPDHPNAEDIALLVSQSRRCSDILKGFARDAAEDRPDMMEPLPPSALLEVISKPFAFENKQVKVEIRESDKKDPPFIRKSPELTHALGNLIQNAIQHARTAVRLEADWTDEDFAIVIQDDGYGFSSYVLGKIGEPFISTKKHGDGNMGLGLFIAQTLLETTGASLAFANAPEGGAKITVRWPRKVVENPDQSA